MPKLVDISGETYGRLYVISLSHMNAHGKAVWWAECSCDGKIVQVLSNSLRSDRQVSCGCHRDEEARRTIKSLKGSNKRMITFRGKTQTLSAWAAELGMQVPGLIKRIRVWGLERALTTPKSK